MRSLGVIVGGGVGTGARSPCLIPAFSAAAVGRKTLTCREGTSTVFCSAPFVGVTTSGTTGTGSSITSGSGIASASMIGAGGGITSSITGASARAAGANRLTSLVTGCCFGGADADTEIDGGGGSEVGAGAGGGVIIGSGSSISGSGSITGASGVGRVARFTTLTVRLTAASFFGKYLFQIFSAISLDTELDGTLTST